MSSEQKLAADRLLGLLRPLERDSETYCRRLVWDDQEAPDAIQNAVLRAFKAFDRYHGDASFRALMFEILSNEVFTLNRQHGRIPQFAFHLEPEELDALPALEQAAEYTDWLLSPEALKPALDQDLVAALKTLSEISDSFDIPLGSVMGNLARARQKMRGAIRHSNQRTMP